MLFSPLTKNLLNLWKYKSGGPSDQTQIQKFYFLVVDSIFMEKVVITCKLCANLLSSTLLWFCIFVTDFSRLFSMFKSHFFWSWSQFTLPFISFIIAFTLFPLPILPGSFLSTFIHLHSCCIRISVTRSFVLLPSSEQIHIFS